MEKELEYGLCTMVDDVKETLSSVSFAEWKPVIMTWNTPFYDIKVFGLSSLIMFSAYVEFVCSHYYVDLIY